MGYISMMLVVWCVMNDLAEMVTYLPMKGISIPYFVERFVDPSLAFAAGWNYWYAYAMLVAAETSAAAIVLDYWKLPVNVAVWIAIVLIIILLLNIIAVGFFGEAEFWFASIKLITIMGLIILGIVLFFGGGPNHDRLGFRYWNDPGAFNEYMTGGTTGRFLAYWHALVKAGFAFITSPELIAIAAGETVDPRRNIPKAAKRFVWRLAIFYGFSSLVIGIIVPSDDPPRSLRRISLSLRNRDPKSWHQRPEPRHQRRNSDLRVVSREFVPLLRLTSIVFDVPIQASAKNLQQNERSRDTLRSRPLYLVHRAPRVFKRVE